MPHEAKSTEPVDGATATAHVAYQLTDCALIFPITPSSPMTEQYSAWSSAGKKNVFGQVPLVKQMQSEAGSAGALHGATSEGALATTFTSSQGLLLMIPNMYKLAGELMPCVFHIAARTIATEALSIFGDHSDIYAVRSTGVAFLFATSVQEAIHMGIAAHRATLESRVPFASVQDGFRTTHEIQKIDWPTQEQIAACVDMDAVAAHRARGLNPQHPVQRGTAQNPDVFFQASVASQPYFERAAEITQRSLDKVNSVFGTNYKLFEYHGDANATQVVVCMGSAFQVLKAAVDALNKMGAKCGCINVRLYRPFSVAHFAAAVPATCTHLCILDRGKDVQAAHEPLFSDVCAAMRQASREFKVMIGGVYGLSSKDFNPDMVAAVFDNLSAAKPIDRFTVGILDDVNKTSLNIPVGKLPSNTVLPEGTKQCLLWGIGGDGTIGANKTAIKLIADNTDLHSQGYFAYDANKSGGLTLSHLRFGPKRFEAPYFVSESDYVACHTTAYVNRFNLVASLKKNGIFLLNCPWRTVEELDAHLPAALRRQLAEREAAFYVIDATKIAQEAGLGGYINMVLQAVFFALSGVVDFQKAITVLKESVVKMYHRKGQEVISKNHKAIDMSCDPALLYRVPFNRDTWLSLALPAEQPKRKGLLKIPNETLEKFNKEIFEPVARYEGETIPVSKFGVGGEIPTATSQLSKRGIADIVPHWHEDKCIQCNQCSFVCPHAVIRSYQISEEEMRNAPASLHSIKSRKAGHQFVIQPSDLDCTGCAVCAEQCPVHCLEMTPLDAEYEACKDNIAFVRDQVKPKPELGDKKNVLGIGSQPPYFEFPGSCAGCGETPLVRLVSQLFGDRMVIAAATGCNSIWGGSYPLVPYCTDSKGEGPAWHNSLFEDGAELGYGMIAAYRQRRELLVSRVQDLLKETTPVKGLTAELRAAFEEWLPVRMDFEKSKVCRDKIKPLLVAAASDASNDVKLRDIGHQQFLDLFARTSFWIIGGDGWAYDIGFGGLDHVIANNEDINILVLDTEVYSNTGGQRSKATPLGAQAKFAADGKDTAKKDLGRICMQYEQAYVASIAQGADFQQSINALKEAENFPGPSIVIAYTPCTEHHMVRGMKDCMKVQKLAVETGYWINYRFNPQLAAQGKNPFTLDSKTPTKKPIEYLKTQGRYVAMEREFPERSQMFEAQLEKALAERFVRYQRMAKLYEPIDLTPATAPTAPAAPAAAPAPGTK